MRINSLRIRNFCQFPDNEFQFGPYLNAIVGPNGSGKTNLLRALLFLITGDAGGDCLKEENIRQAAAANEDAWVMGEISHRDRLYQIRRGLRPARVWLRIDGELVAHTITEVNRVLATELDITGTLLRDYVIVQQRQVDAWINLTPRERALEWAQLFNLERAETIHREIGEYLTGLPQPQLSETPEALQARIADWEREREALTAELQSLGLPHDLADYMQQRYAILEQAKTWNLHQETVRQRQSELQQAEQAGTEIKEALQAAEQAANEATSRVAAMQHEKAQWENYVQRWQRWQEYVQNQTHWHNEVQRFLQTEPRPRWRVFPTSAMTVEQVQQELAKVNATLQQLQKTKDLLRIDDLDKLERCPVCQQPWSQKQRLECRRHWEACMTEEMTLKQQLERLQALQAQLSQVAQERQRLQQQRQLFRTRLRSYRSRKPQPPEVEQPPVSQAQCLSQLTLCTTYQQKANEAEQRVAQLRVLCEVRQAAYEEAQRRYQSAYQDWQALPEKPTAEMLACAEAELAKAKELVAHQQRLQQQLGILDWQITETRQRLTVLAQQQQEAARITRIRDCLSIVRKAFHHEAAPKAATQAYLAAIAQETNSLLDRFQAPFRVEVDETSGFSCHFHTGMTFSDRRLSGGQKTLLGLALRIAVNSILANQLGLLILDEPADGLDEQNLNCLPVALEHLAETCRQQRLQVLFVTHMQQFAPLFDQVIHLS